MTNGSVLINVLSQSKIASFLLENVDQIDEFQIKETLYHFGLSGSPIFAVDEWLSFINAL